MSLALAAAYVDVFGLLLFAAVAGHGLSSTSLFLFATVTARVRRRLEAGDVPPALPRPEPLWPYFQSAVAQTPAAPPPPRKPIP